MKTPHLFLAGALAILATLWSIQHADIRRLHSQIDSLTPALQESQALRTRLDSRSPPVDPAELARLRALRPELARLRATAAQLRKQSRATPNQLQAEALDLQREADLITARLKAQADAGAARVALMEAAQLLASTWQHFPGPPPASWDDVAKRLEQSDPPNLPMVEMLREMMTTFRRPDGPLHKVEILPLPASIDPKNPSHADTLLLRERTPRPHPDGGFSRAYARLNGRVEDVRLPDDNFAAWEQTQTGNYRNSP